MKSFVTTCIVVSWALATHAFPARHHHGIAPTASPAAAAQSASPSASTSTATGGTAGAAGAITQGPSTLVLFEVNGVPGNECLTFRNNGEIVDAACVDTSADRQITPSTDANGNSVLLVQRTFTAGFRPDLVGVQACVGNNGTDFLAQDCATATSLVSFVAGQLKAGTACASGHDGAAQMTVDPTGKTCATYTTATVAPAPATG